MKKNTYLCKTKLHAMHTAKANSITIEPLPLTGGTEAVYYFHSDHLGSASWITDGSGLPVQHLQYLPFGEHFVNEHSSGYDERFTFTGKERDAETGYYYHGARFNCSDIGWLSVDPMADKYPSISPYAYCAWNPVKLVDPEGEDVYETDGEGGFKRVRWAIIDKVYSVDKEGNKVNTITFKKGTIQEVIFNYDENEKFNIVQVKGDKQAEALFEFLATPENFNLKAGDNVEWGRYMTGNAGKNGINFLTTSGEIDGDRAGSDFFDKTLKNGYVIRGHDHNHPTNNPYPSGSAHTNGDIPYVKYMKNNGNVAADAKFRIFTPGLNQKYHFYDENSTIELLPVIVKP